jgi:peroxiredoxin Q/BCP
MNELALGDALPYFSLKDQNGAYFKSNEAIGTAALVIFFYPKNFTPGCIREVCEFRDYFEEFGDIGATVIGISGDSEKSHQKFVKSYRLPFTLLSDPKNKVRKLFGVKKKLMGMLPGRETFVFDNSGILTFKFSAMGADAHIQKALQHLQKK